MFHRTEPKCNMPQIENRRACFVTSTNGPFRLNKLRETVQKQVCFEKQETISSILIHCSWFAVLWTGLYARRKRRNNFDCLMLSPPLPQPNPGDRQSFTWAAQPPGWPPSPLSNMQEWIWLWMHSKQFTFPPPSTMKLAHPSSLWS
jgi:hypothetical protein